MVVGLLGLSGSFIALDIADVTQRMDAGREKTGSRTDEVAGV